MNLKHLSTGLALALGLSVLSSPAMSAMEVSGKKNLVCASLDMVACTHGNCLKGQAHTFDIPTFMFVDVKRRLVHAKDKDGKSVDSPVKNFEITDKAIVLQGFENHRSWSLGIERETGSMTMSSTGASVSFIVFGNCIEN